MARTFRRYKNECLYKFMNLGVPNCHHGVKLFGVYHRVASGGWSSVMSEWPKYNSEGSPKFRSVGSFKDG
jgi:hypothetical protein